MFLMASRQSVVAYPVRFSTIWTVELWTPARRVSSGDGGCQATTWDHYRGLEQDNKQRFGICQFRFTYRLILREKELHLHIGVFNPNQRKNMTTFSFNVLLHTYLKVPDGRCSSLSRDQGTDGTIIPEDAPQELYLCQHTSQEHIITNTSCTGERKMRDDGYPKMICEPRLRHHKYFRLLKQ
uniref:Uncharacterized protein n=1 Tax=Anopheles farauti TaxID=69004 RepID=A0A182QJD7_9DIPT